MSIFLLKQVFYRKWETHLEAVEQTRSCLASSNELREKLHENQALLADAVQEAIDEELGSLVYEAEEDSQLASNPDIRVHRILTLQINLIPRYCLVFWKIWKITTSQIRNSNNLAWISILKRVTTSIRKLWRANYQDYKCSRLFQ